MIDSTFLNETINLFLELCNNSIAITYDMNYKTLHFKTSTEYSLQYHNTQVQTKSKQQLQYNHGLGTGQRQNSRKVRT